MQNSETDDVFDKAIDRILYGVFAFGVFWFWGVILYQVYYWLRYAEWLSLPFSFAFNFFGVDLSMVYSPESWRGVAIIAQWLLWFPLSLMVPVAIISFIFLLWLFIKRHSL